MAKYWATTFNKVKTVHDFLLIHQWMPEMEKSVQIVQGMENIVGHSQPLPNTEAHDSNEDGTTIEISSAPTFGLDDNNVDEAQQPLPSDDFITVLEDEVSSVELDV